MNTLPNFNEGLSFIPLGGSEQFGVNLNVYAADDQFLAIDCGIGFADERFPGIDLLLPDPAFLAKQKKKLQGLIITHAHEDHIGAVAHLWNRLKCDLYATPFTASILKRKLEENNIKKAKIHIMDTDAGFTLGAFDLQFLPVAHSVPDAVAVLIEAGGVKALHSGDWNLDPAPIASGKTEAKAFKAIGPVDAYIGDSTNSGVPGRAGSESEIEDGLYNEFKHCNGRIFVTTFSSNIGRLISILRAAKRAERLVAVVGRSMHRMISAAVECGLFTEELDFVAEDEVDALADENVVVVCTGSQGEPRAALSRISRGDHRNITSRRGDTVIFSARTIPGNEIGINEVKNNLIAGGVRVVTPRDTKHNIHVSGHPCQDEILEMWSWIKPKLVVPVHGEREQLDAHAQLAKSAQIKNVVVPNNGSVIQLAPGKAGVIDHVETGLLAVDQKRIIDASHASIAERRKLQYTGTAFISVVIDGKGRLQGDVRVQTMGLIDAGDEEDLALEDRLYDRLIDELNIMKPAERTDEERVEKKLSQMARRYCNKTFGLKPMTIVHVIRV